MGIDTIARTVPGYLIHLKQVSKITDFHDKLCMTCLFIITCEAVYEFTANFSVHVCAWPYAQSRWRMIIVIATWETDRR